MSKDVIEILVQLGARRVKHVSSFEVPSAENIVREYWPHYRKYGLDGFDYYDKKIFQAAVFLVKLNLGSTLYWGGDGKLWERDGYRYVVNKVSHTMTILPVTGFEEDFEKLTGENDEPSS